MYARDILAGINEFSRAHGPWSASLGEHGRGDHPPEWLARWQGDGIIARVENPEIARALAATGLPVVNVSFDQLLADAPTFTTDNSAIARAAVSHFAERGFRHFAYCGKSEFVWAVDRGVAFARRVREEGRECHHFICPAEIESGSDAETDGIAAWLTGLPRPLAVLCCYDLRGRQVLEACRRAQLAVPDDIAVLSVDNDELLCSFSVPPLSSVILDARRTGWLAAEALAKLMAGAPRTDSATFIPPLGVATRQSTDTLAVGDAQLAKALRFIRENACARVGVADVLRHCPMSRRGLEQRMKAVIGRTPHQEILRVQIERAKLLLATTSLSLPEIAEKCGFRHAEYLSAAFKREVGVPPSEFRKSGGHHGAV